MKTILSYISLLLLFVFGLVLLFNGPIQSRLISDLNDSPNQTSRDTINQNQDAEATFDFEQVEDLDFSTILSARQEELPGIGWIAIPEVDMRLSILKGVSNTNLAAGAGTMKPDQVMGNGNYALAGHNRAGNQLLFNPLHRVEEGMQIYLTDIDNIYIYEIYSIEMVDPSRIDVIEDSGSDIITLVTCNVDGSRRLIVQGNFIEQMNSSQASSDLRALFEL